MDCYAWLVAVCYFGITTSHCLSNFGQCFSSSGRNHSPPTLKDLEATGQVVMPHHMLLAKVPSCCFLFLHHLSPINFCIKRDHALEQHAWRGHISLQANFDNPESCLDVFPYCKRPILVPAEKQNCHTAITSYSSLWFALKYSWKHFLLQNQTFIAQSYEKIPCSCDF